jgi:nucleoside-diphosphate-sugar epimerase/uncharacterized membrane protein
MKEREVVLITGSSGFIGRKLALALSQEFHVVGIDRSGPKEKSPGIYHYDVDITSEEDVSRVLHEIKNHFGPKVRSVIHLVAYYDFRGGDDSRYDTITVNGSKFLIKKLHEDFEVDKFIFSSSMLIYKPVEVGQRLQDDSELHPTWAYPESKVKAESALKEEQGNIPVINLRIAGVYDDDCHSPTVSQQIMRIYEGQFSSFLFPGNPDAGQAFIHVDDLRDAIVLLVKKDPPTSLTENYIIGEEDVMSFKEIQHDAGILIHKRPWPSVRVPEFIAKTGATVMDHLPVMREPFIKSWMVEHADEHFAVDMSKLKKAIDWTPKRSLRGTLPVMIQKLKENPDKWYEINKIKMPFYRNLKLIGTDGEKNLFFAAYINIFLGLWLMGNPFTFGAIESGEFYSQLISGALVVILASLSLIPTVRWLRWINATIGFWLLFSPLIFETLSAAAYSNDTLLGALIILVSAYTPSYAPGFGTPPGWSYNPSTAGQRLPIMFLAFLGYLGSRYLTAYQLGHIDSVWDPIFGEGTQTVLTSSVSQAFPISDAGLGALTYLLDLIAASIGGRDRWRSLPWAVILFGLMIIPSGVTSITLIMLQPISVGAWCTICLFTAFIMLLMVPPAVDEVLASVQFLIRRKKAGEKFWKVFWFGSDVKEEQKIPEIRKEGNIIHLYLTTLLSVWLMFAPFVLKIQGIAFASTYIVASLLITFSIIAMSEVARLVRLMNIPLGIWLAMSGWLLSGMSDTAKWQSLIVGILIIFLSLPRGKRKQAYGNVDRIIHWTPIRR